MPPPILRGVSTFDRRGKGMTNFFLSKTQLFLIGISPPYFIARCAFRFLLLFQTAYWTLLVETDLADFFFLPFPEIGDFFLAPCERSTV